MSRSIDHCPVDANQSWVHQAHRWRLPTVNRLEMPDECVALPHPKVCQLGDQALNNANPHQTKTANDFEFHAMQYRRFLFDDRKMRHLKNMCEPLPPTWRSHPQ